ncbi:MAG TPA: META domain-containing protein [Ornithinibacter sp.]|nr:META domain-containing protein [Ornithinibacter sp.]
MSGADSVAVQGLDDLTGTWVTIAGPQAPAEVLGTVGLTFADRRVFVATGCNSARGEVAVADGRLVADHLASSRMMCEPALMAQEDWIVTMLTSRPRLERAGSELTLLWGPDEQWRLVLRLQPAEPAA